MVGRAASLLGAKIGELEKEVPRLMLAGGAGPAPHSPGAQEGRAECPHMLQLSCHQHCWQVERRDSAFAWARSYSLCHS